jgi:nucleotide-binding universal stress UspA family protein
VLVSNSRILVASDESSAGRHAVSMARVLAKGAGAELTILRAVVAPEAGNVPSGRFDSTAGDSSPEGEIPADLARFLDWLGPENGGTAGPVVEVAVAFGVPGIEIGRMAELRGVDLIVIGRRRSNEGEPPILGETADALIRRCDRPVLAVPERVTELRTILAALDGSARGRPVLAGARRFAAMVGGTLAAVTVEPLLADEEIPGVQAPRRARSFELGRLLREGDGPAGGAPPLRVRRGDPVQEILAEVAATRTSVLVVGYRRGGPPKQVGPTEIARGLVFAAPCAVLTVPL